MKINVKDNLTIQIYHHFRSNKPITDGWNLPDGWYGAPSEDSWLEMLEWARENCIVCRRGRGTDLIFERKEDITAFVLRWS